jgi:short-subunit dehydrogenase
MKVNGKVAFITGAGSGIGRAIANSLAKRGCHLALVDINQNNLEQTADELKKFNVNVSTLVLDVTDTEAVKTLPQEVINHHGAIDLVVNNAGIAAGGTFLMLSEVDFDRVIDINFNAVVKITRAFLPYLLKREEARIVNISSLFGLISPAEQTAYSASKFAVRGFSNALRHELDGTPVGVSVVHPGGIATNIAESALKPEGATLEEVNMKMADAKRLLRMPPAKAGETIVKAIEKNKARIIVGVDAKALTLIERLMPNGYWRIYKFLSGVRK